MFRITEIRTLSEPDWKSLRLSNEEVRQYVFEKTARDRRLARYESVMKVLKPDQCYKLVSEKLPYDFFSLSDSAHRLPKINISVIVGENGMGKSSLIDLMLRLINNAAYALRLGLDDHETYNLRFVRDIYASMTFERDSCKYCLEQRDSVISLTKCVNNAKLTDDFGFANDANLTDDATSTDGSNGSLIWKFDFCRKSSLIPREEARQALSELFYTIVVNYSAYGNNVEDMQPEYSEDYELETWEIEKDGQPKSNVDPSSRIWMFGILNKNDSYQLPLVLTPYRSRGNMNINNEQNLSRDRMCYLAMMNPSPLDGILEGKTPHSIVFDVNSRFSTITIYGYEGVNMLSFGLLDEVKWIAGDLEKIENYREGIAKFSKDIIKLWCKVWNLDFFALAKAFNEKSSGDGERALSYLVYKTVKIAGSYFQFKHYTSDLEILCRSYLKPITYEDWERGADPNLNVIDNKHRLEKYIKALSEHTTHITLKLRRTLALLIFQHYSSKIREYSLQKFNEVINETLNEQRKILNNLYKEYYFNKSSATLLDEGGDNLFSEYGNVLSNKDIKDLRARKWVFDELMPSPCIRTDVRFRLTNEDNSGEGFIPAKSLSSGERQLLNVLSGVVYHLNNIASKFSNRKIRGLRKEVNSEEVKPSINYSYVSLIFDEAELYFHPKYQTQFIRATLAAIAGLNIADKIKGINILYSTHSPFILSDMPQCNVLALEDGKPATESIGRTFCANVYDILANGFFMDTFVGMFAADKVKSIIRSLEIRPDVNPKTREAWQPKASIMDESNFNPATLQKEIELIGDDFIRNSLLQRWRDRFSEQLSLIEERNRLIKRLSEIDSKLNNPQDNDSDKV